MDNDGEAESDGTPAAPTRRVVPADRPWSGDAVVHDSARGVRLLRYRPPLLPFLSPHPPHMTIKADCLSVTGAGARAVVASYGRRRRGGAAGIGCATCGPLAHGNGATIRLIYHMQHRPWYDSSLPPSDAILFF